MTQRWEYDPFDCDCSPEFRPSAEELFECDPRDCCCTDPVLPDPDNPVCGAAASQIEPLPECSSPIVTDPPITPKINSDGDCPDNMAEAKVLCGNETRYGCIPDSRCATACEAPERIPLPGTVGYGDLCSGDATGVLSGTLNTFVREGECTDPIKCETQCADGYSPSSQPPIPAGQLYGDPPHTLCACAIGMDTTGCPTGFYNATGCAPNEAVSCCRPPP